MNQPEWELLGNLGDTNPIESGGLFVYRDKTGVYDFEMELLEPLENGRFEVSRVCLDKCTFIDGILSDNKFHPDMPAWFATPEARRADRPQDSNYLSRVCEFSDYPMDELIADLCSDDPIARASGYRSIAEFHGYINFDNYPLTLTRKEVKARYKLGELE